MLGVYKSMLIHERLYTRGSLIVAIMHGEHKFLGICMWGKISKKR